LRAYSASTRSCRRAPVDAQAAKPQQERFSALGARLQERVDAEYARNRSQKESLIERARQLLASDGGRKAVDGIKELQQAWRTVGPVPRELDQRLWEKFRGHCDAVFQKRQQESAAHASGLENNKTQAIALCERIEGIAALEGEALLAGAATVAEVRRAFDGLGEFPRADTRALRNRLDRALERYDKALARQRARDAEHGWNELFEAARHVRAYRLAVARGLEPAQLDTLKQAADSALGGAARSSRQGIDALRHALARTQPEDLAANERALRTLCVRAEILVDAATPAEDQALRRDYQLQRLVQRMGQGVRADDTQLDGMTIEWMSVGPVEETVYEQLVRRFRSCRDRDGTRDR